MLLETKNFNGNRYMSIIVSQIVAIVDRKDWKTEIYISQEEDPYIVDETYDSIRTKLKSLLEKGE